MKEKKVEPGKEKVSVDLKETLKAVYEKPSLNYHGKWQALTLQFSVPITIVDESING